MGVFKSLNIYKIKMKKLNSPLILAVILSLVISEDTNKITTADKTKDTVKSDISKEN